MKQRSLLAIRGLRVERSRVILEHLDWSIGPDEHWAVLGPNGSGKTSLLKAVFGYMTPTAGTIELDGHAFGAADWAAVRDRIGLVSHSLQGRIEDSERVEDVILSGKTSQLNYWGEPTAAELRAARRILREMNLGGRGGEPWGQLSQGERQRTLLGRALHGRRRILFLDEPCAGLDPVARLRFLRHLEAFAGRPRSPRLVLITHHLEEIFPAVTHVLLLREGQVVAAGPKADVLRSGPVAETFGVPLTIRRTGSTWHIRFATEEHSDWF